MHTLDESDLMEEQGRGGLNMHSYLTASSHTLDALVGQLGLGEAPTVSQREVLAYNIDESIDSSESSDVSQQRCGGCLLLAIITL